MDNLLKSISLGNIIGLGESSHGSKDEFEQKYTLILNTIKSKPDSKFVCYFEAYEDCFSESSIEPGNSSSPLKRQVDRYLDQMYAIWKTKETYDFLLEILKLNVFEKRDIKIIGIDFRNKEHKQSFSTTDEMLKVRDRYMFENIKKTYCSDAIHFVTAHNAHIGRYNTEDHNSIGYFLDQEFKDIYIPVAQHASRGHVRAKWNGGDYQPVDLKYDSIPGSVTLLANTVFLEKVQKDRPLVFNTSESVFEGIDSIQQAGFYLPLEKPWIMPFGKQYFDYLILHPKSKPAESL